MTSQKVTIETEISLFLYSFTSCILRVREVETTSDR